MEAAKVSNDSFQRKKNLRKYDAGAKKKIRETAKKVLAAAADDKVTNIDDAEKALEFVEKAKDALENVNSNKTLNSNANLIAAEKELERLISPQ